MSYGGPSQLLAVLLVVGGAVVAAGTWPGYIMPVGIPGAETYVPGHWEPVPVIAFKTLALLVAAIGGWMRGAGAGAVPDQQTAVKVGQIHLYTCQDCAHLESHPAGSAPTCDCTGTAVPMQDSGPARV